MPRAGDSSVPSARVIFWVALWVLKQYQGLPLQAGAALAAHGPPVEDHEVAGRDVGDARADGLDHAGRLVPEQEREVVVDAALAVVQVGVADAAGLHLHQRLARARVGDQDRLDVTGAPLLSATTPRTSCGICGLPRVGRRVVLRCVGTILSAACPLLGGQRGRRPKDDATVASTGRHAGFRQAVDRP